MTDVELMLVLKFGGMNEAYRDWMDKFDDISFTQEESDFIAQYAVDNNKPTGAYTYEY